MKKIKHKFLLAILIIAISGGAALKLIAQEKNLNEQLWYHWSPGLCFTPIPGGVHAESKCDTPDPFGPCFISMDCGEMDKLNINP